VELEKDVQVGPYNAFNSDRNTTASEVLIHVDDYRLAIHRSVDKYMLIHVPVIPDRQ